MTYEEIMDLEDAAAEAARKRNRAAQVLRKARGNYTPKHIAYSAACREYDAIVARLDSARLIMEEQEAADAARAKAEEIAAEAARQPSFF